MPVLHKKFNSLQLSLKKLNVAYAEYLLKSDFKIPDYFSRCFYEKIICLASSASQCAMWLEKKACICQIKEILMQLLKIKNLFDFKINIGPHPGKHSCL